MTDQPATEYWPAEIEPEPPDARRDRNAAAVLLLREGWELDEVDRVLKEVCND